MKQIRELCLKQRADSENNLTDSKSHSDDSSVTEPKSDSDPDSGKTDSSSYQSCETTESSEDMTKVNERVSVSTSNLFDSEQTCSISSESPTSSVDENFSTENCLDVSDNVNVTNLVDSCAE